MAAERSPSLHEGTVTRLRVEVEGADAVVVRFVLETGDDRRPVEMRGERLLGVLDEGDRVAIGEGSARERTDTTLRPSALANLTTGGMVEVTQPTPLARAGRAIGVREIRSAAISAGVGGVIAVLVARVFSDSDTPQGGIAPAPEDESSLTVVLVLAGIFALVAGSWLLVRRRLPGRVPKWSPLVGLAIGLLAIGILTA